MSLWVADKAGRQKSFFLCKVVIEDQDKTSLTGIGK